MGGECPEDMEHLRQDAGLAAMLGCTPPAAETARQWLDKFHEEALMVNRPVQGSFLPPESKSLAGLGELNRKAIWAYVKTALPRTWLIAEIRLPALEVRQPDTNAKAIPWVTIDIDAHLVETHKEGALYCYDGYKAFQPIIVTWAETGLILVDEFRNGNGPGSIPVASMAPTPPG